MDVCGIGVQRQKWLLFSERPVIAPCWLAHTFFNMGLNLSKKGLD